MSRCADQREVVKEHFNDYAVNNRWGDLYNPEHPQSHSFIERRRKTLELLGDLNERRLLDLGCGSGALLEGLAHQNVEYHGIDISPRMIQCASSRIEELGLTSRYSVQVGDVESLPYSPAYFDAVVGMGLLEYFDQPQRLLNEVLRVAKPGARLVFTIPKKFCLNDLLVRVTEPARAVVRAVIGKTPEIERALYTRKAFQGLLTAAGCAIVGEADYNTLILPYPVPRFWPKLAYAAAARAEGKKGLRFFATGYIVACTRPGRSS